MSPPRDITIDSQQPDLGMDVSAFIGATSISFVVADPSRPDTPIVYVNRAFELTTGYSHRFVIGRNCRFLQGPDTDPEAVRNIAIALSRGEGVRQTLLNYRADGSEFVNDLVITPLKDADGQVAYFVGVQREVEPALDNAEEVLRRRTVDIVRQQVQIHLSVVMQMSRMHMADDDPTASSGDFLGLLRRLEILDLLYENITAETVQNERFDAGAYISQVAAKLVARAPRPGVRINISTDEALVALDTAVRLGVILAELLDLALTESFSGTEGGQLEVTLRAEGGTLVLSVFDDGGASVDGPAWLESGDITLRMIQQLLKEAGGTLDAPSMDEGREFRISMPMNRPSRAARTAIDDA